MTEGHARRGGRVRVEGRARARVVGLTGSCGLALLLAAAPGCHGKVTREDCTAMLDHYIDLSIGDDPSLAGLPPAQQATVREMKKAVKKGEKSYRRVQERCEQEITRKEYDCAMKAPNANEWEACID